MKIDIISDNSLIIPEYIIDIKNKSKKTIELIEQFEKLKNLEEQKVNNVIELKENEIKEIKIDPKKIGIKFNNPENLKGNDAHYNANKIIDAFSGVKNEFSEAICLNSAAALIVSGKFSKFEDGYEFSKKHLETDKALSHLKKIQTF